MNPDTDKLTITTEEEGMRLDVFLSSLYESYSRSFFQKRIASGDVTVNGKTVKSGYSLSVSDEICVSFPEPSPLSVEPENIPLNVVYEDSDVIVVDKPKNMVVHPAAGHFSGTLVNALLYHCSDLSGINGVLRPGIVHRIDKDTTGLIIACKNDFAHQEIAKQLKDHTVTRLYRAIVCGNLKDDEGTIRTFLARSASDRKKIAVADHGKEAITHYRVIERFGNYTFAEFQLETGRTHQIRVHMAHIGHPLLGDDVYGNHKSPFKTEGQTLHAAVLGFVHPRTKEFLLFESPLPSYFETILSALRKG